MTIMNKQDYFRLFASCINVRGAKEAIIMDIQSQRWLTIPLLMSDILVANEANVTITCLKKKFSNKYNKGIDRYFQFFVENEYGFYTDTPELFPPLKFSFQTPFRLLSAVICFSNESKYDIKDVIRQLTSLNCQIVHILVERTNQYPQLFEALNGFRYSTTKRVDIFSPYNEGIMNFLDNYKTADRRIFINIIGNSEPHIQCNPYLTLIHHIKGIWTKYPQEIIKKNNFVCNFSHYEEALTHNVGLNRKITIDYNGDLKNFYSHSLIFGNVIDMPISDVIDNKLFQIKWDISNDHIRKCKDCQYRYMCLSNSDLNYENGMYEKKDNCQFDPYSNKWE